MMQPLPLHEEDTVLFNSHVNRTLYTMYRDNAEKFTLMWEQQGPGYWLKFCISLRSVMQKQGFSVQLVISHSNVFESFFIDLATLLTGKRVELIHTYVKDVVSVSRFHQLMGNVPSSFTLQEAKMSLAFERLFGHPQAPGTVMKMFVTLPLHLRGVGCLLRLMQRWLLSKSVMKLDKPLWHPPESWHHGNQLQANRFEVFLKKGWDMKLLSLLGVCVSDICWWNALPQGDRSSELQQRHSDVGHFIASVCREHDILVPNAGLLENEMLIHHFVASSPRGKFRVLSTQPVTVVFLTSLFRGMFMVDEMSTFHPFSQVISSFTSAAFSNTFWFGQGLIFKLSEWRNKYESDTLPAIVMDRKTQVNFLLGIVSSHMIRARLAATLNSHFYDTLYGGITWTSPATVVRFPWNIQLLINWLELLLADVYESKNLKKNKCKIILLGSRELITATVEEYKSPWFLLTALQTLTLFERYFMPLCNFPLHNNMVSLVEHLYRSISEAEFLVKTCIIVADGIFFNEGRGSLLCHTARPLLNAVIPRLVRTMQFLQKDAYSILDVILQTGWTREEREDGECCVLVNDRIKVDMAAWDTLPDIDIYYSDNFRHITYWITEDEWPDIDGGHVFFTEAVEMLREYNKGHKTAPGKKQPYKFSVFKNCAQGQLRFTNIDNKPAQELFGFVSSISKLLVDDGWLCASSLEQFWPHFNAEYNLVHIEQKLNDKSNVDADDGFQFLKEMEDYSAVYYVTACLLGDTWHRKLTRQNAFARLQQNETLAIMAVAGARLSAFTQKINSKIVACPPVRYFKDAAAEIQKRLKDCHLSTDEAVGLLETFEQEASRKVHNSTAEALTAVRVPALEEMNAPGIGTDWLKYLEKKRVQLLQLMSDEQFSISRSFEKQRFILPTQLFPLRDVLENRLVEEMAAMHKCLEMGTLFYGHAYGLCRLLAHRFTWLQQSFVKWKKGKHKAEVTITLLSNKNIFRNFVDIYVRTLAAVIPLQALFFTYISQYRTTHPITEMTIKFTLEWLEEALLWLLDDKWNMLGSCLADYVDALERMGYLYIEQMLVHCEEVWVVEPFCVDPEASVEFGSIQHAQQIVTTFTQLFLMSCHTVLVEKPKISFGHLADVMLNELICVITKLRQVELDDTLHSWPKARQILKKDLRGLWSSLGNLRKHLGPSKSSYKFPSWHLNHYTIWKTFFKIFTSSQYRNILQKIAFSEFINSQDPECKDTTIINIQITKNNENKTKMKPVAQKPDDNFTDKTSTVAEKTADVAENSNAAKNNFDDGDNNGVESVIRRMKQKGKKKHVVGSEGSKQNSVHFQDDVHLQDDRPESEVQNKYKRCTNCKSVEPERRTYKKCSLCKKENWSQPRFYCSQECQVKDWHVRHSMEHKTGTQRGAVE